MAYSSIEGKSFEQLKITARYFFDEVIRFREIMCSTAYTAEQKENAFGGLAYVYLNVDPKDPQYSNAETTFEATVNEYTRRKVYEMFMPRRNP
jgi:hypothetical protein